MRNRVIINELKSFLKYWIPIVLLIISLIYFILAPIILNSQIIMNVPQIGLSIFGIIFTTNIYQKYDVDFFKKNFVFKEDRTVFKIKLFFLTFILIFLAFFIMLGLVLFFNQIVPFDFVFAGKEDKFIILWNETPWGIIFWSAFWESIILVSFLYLINHYIKNDYVLFGVLTIMILLSLLGSTLIWNNYWFRYDFYNDSVFKIRYLVHQNAFFWLNIIFLPWTQISMLTGDVFSYWRILQHDAHFNGFELIYKSFFLTSSQIWLVFLPYLNLFLIFIIILISNNFYFRNRKGN